MDESILLSLPREIRDQIYSYVLVGIGPSTYVNTRCAPAYYLRSSVIHTDASKHKTPDIMAMTARQHPILATCRQISSEAYPAFLTNNEFIQDILVSSLTLSACKSLRLFINGLGDHLPLVRRLGLAIEEPGDAELHAILTWMVKLRNTRNIRPGALVLVIKTTRPTKTPPLFAPVGQSWTIGPKDEDTLTLDLVIGDETCSWTSFGKSLERDWDLRRCGTQRVLDACRNSGMKGVDEREQAWQEERRVWWEETREVAQEKFKNWLARMHEVQQKEKVVVTRSVSMSHVSRSKVVMGQA